jgi:CrcB protein
MALWAAQRFGSAFPYGTLVVNLIGCFIIAALMHAAVGLDWSPTTRAALTIGFIGGFTTYSSFNYETMRLVEEGALGAAALNTALTVFGGWTSGLLGLITARLDALAAASGRAKSNLSRTLHTMARYRLVRLEKGEGRKVKPVVTFERVELRLALAA